MPALTGIAATSGGGTLSPDQSVALTGASAATSAGTLSPAVTISLAGSAATSSAGTLLSRSTLSLTGAAGASAAGLASASQSIVGSFATVRQGRFAVLITNQGVYPSVPEDENNERDHRRRMARAINLLLLARMNCVLDVTLTPGAATTTIQDARILASSVIFPAMALTASAAAALAAGIYVTNISGATAFQSGSATINHNNTADTDKVIRFLIVG